MAPVLGVKKEIPSEKGLVMTPSIVQADDWFKQQVVPKRTASSGLSANRVWKTPRDVFTGNQEDPNGLCGDAALFVCEQFFRDFKDYTTRDGYFIGVILWESSLAKRINHIANVMLPMNKKILQGYSWNKSTGSLLATSATVQYSGPDLLNLHTYDLYYKESANVDAWWKRRDAGRGGTITVGTEPAFS
jgi:hypothetical protein